MTPPLDIKRMLTDSKYCIDNYMLYNPYNSCTFNLNSIQLDMIDNFENENRPVISYRQSGTSTVLLSHAIWDTFIKPGSRNNVILTSKRYYSPTTMIDQIYSFTYDELEKSGYDIGKITFRNDKIIHENGNQLFIANLSNVNSWLRGMRFSSIYSDNCFGADYDGIYINSTVTGAKLHVVESGLFHVPTKLEESENTLFYPFYYSNNYSLQQECLLINNIGEERYNQEYLLRRI